MIVGTMILPYSYLSVIQHFQDEAVEDMIETYYTDDYYNLKGQTQLHKFMYDIDKLEKIIDCFWRQNPNYLFAILAREEKDTKIVSENHLKKLMISGANWFGEPIN